MVNKQLDHLPTTAHCGQVKPVTVRSALLNRNIPRRRCAQQVRFKDKEEEGPMAPEGRTVPERCRLGAGPGSPHPNRKSTLGAASSSAVVGEVWGDMVETVGGVAAILGIVPHPLTPSPMRPLCITRNHSHSLEDVIGTPSHPSHRSAAQIGCYAHSRLPHREGRHLKDEREKSTISPPLPQLHTDSSPSPPISLETGSTNPTQSRRHSLERALSDRGNEDLPRPAPPHMASPHTLPPCVAPPTAENSQTVERGGVKKTQQHLPPLPVPPPPNCSPDKGSCSPRQNHTPPMPRIPDTPLMTQPRQNPMPRPPHNGPMPQSTPPTNRGSSKRDNWVGTIINTHYPIPNRTLHQQPYDSRGTRDPPLTPDQAQTLKELERLLSEDQGGDGSKGGLLDPQRPMCDVQGPNSRLQSLEGLLENSHNTVCLLMHVIQDLELKEGQSERRTNYRTSQNMEKQAADNACVIDSVENDFRLQEGIFTQCWMNADSQVSDHISSSSSSSQEEPFLLAPPPFTDQPPRTGRPSCPPKKSRRKCFWFL